MTAPARDFTRIEFLARAAGIFAVSLIVYFPALRGGFLWDDDHYVTALGLRSWHGLWLIWTRPGATQQYFPVLHTAFWMEWHLWGQRVLGYHLTNVVLHSAAACLFGLALRQFGIRSAYFGSLLFALHPVAAESVAWIAEEKNTLSAAFFMAAALTYLKFDANRRPLTYAGAIALFALALLTKTTTAPLPAALLALLWWKQGHLSWRRDVLPLAPWLVLAAALGIFTAWVEHTIVGARGSDFDLSIAQRFLLAARLVWFYLGKFVWPLGLNLGYSRWPLDSHAGLSWVYPVALFAILGAAWALRRMTRAPLALFFSFIGLLFPVLGFLNIYWFIYSYAADHFQYLANAALITGVAIAWGHWHDSRGRHAAATVAAATVCFLGVLTWCHARSFKNLETLYGATIENNPQSWFAENNLGILLRDSGRAKEAEPHLEEAVRLRPDAMSHYNLGVALALIGKSDEAIAHYNEALRIEPNYPGVHYALARALASSGHLAEAISHYRQALKLGFALAEVHTNLGNALADSGRTTEAADEYCNAVRISPEAADAQYFWGNLLINSGHYLDAIPHLDEAIRLQPNYPEAHYDLGVAFANEGRNSEAAAQYQEALRERANYPQAESNLGAALATQGDLQGAVAHYKRAIALKPDDPIAHYNLGLALQNLGLSKEAQDQLKEAARLNGADR